MGFMDSVSRGSGSSGVFGQPGPVNDNDELYLVNKLRDRDMQDYKDKAEYDDDRQIRQQMRMRSMFPPEKLNTQDMNHVMGGTTLSPDQQIDFSHRMQQPELDVEKQKIQSQNKFGQDRLAISAAQEKLNETKNTQMNEDRDLDRQRKIDEANKKLLAAQEALKVKDQNSDEALKLHKQIAEAMEERHKLELENRAHEFNKTYDLHQQRIKQLEEQLKQGANQETTTEVNPDGTKKTVTVKKGDAAINAPVKNPDGTYTVVAPDGTKGIIPVDKLQHWLDNYHPKGGGE